MENQVTLGAVVHKEYEIKDSNDDLVDPSTVSLIVTKPDNTTTNLSGTLVNGGTGLRTVDYQPATIGRYIFQFRTTGPITADDYVFYVVTSKSGTIVTLAEVKTYLGTTSWSDPDIQAALDAETFAQMNMCRLDSNYNPDLAEALKRRVQRNLAMRQMPLAMAQGDAEGGFSRIPGRDPEIRRLEAPYRKLVVS